jgi:hypothetical protein
MNELDQALKYSVAEGADAWEAARIRFVAQSPAGRVADLKQMDQWLDRDPQRTKSYAVLAKRKRELEAIHNSLMSLGR